MNSRVELDIGIGMRHKAVRQGFTDRIVSQCLGQLTALEQLVYFLSVLEGKNRPPLSGMAPCRISRKGRQVDSVEGNLRFNHVVDVRASGGRIDDVPGGRF